jgi:hypothetical protein
MVPDVYLTKRRYEFQSLYYAIILIFLCSKQQSTHILRYEFQHLYTDRIFIIAAVFDTEGVSLSYGNSSAADYMIRCITEACREIDDDKELCHSLLECSK